MKIFEEFYAKLVQSFKQEVLNKSIFRIQTYHNVTQSHAEILLTRIDNIEELR